MDKLANFGLYHLFVFGWSGFCRCDVSSIMVDNFVKQGCACGIEGANNNAANFE